MPEDNNNSWSGALREQIVWFVFAILLALGSSYLNARLQITTIETRVARAEEDITNLETKLSKEEARRRQQKLDLIRLEEKIDALLRKNDIDPESFRDPSRFSNN